MAHLGAAAGRKLLRARARLRRGFSIGIAGRLATSFAAVAVLAIAANVMIEREIAVVQTTRLDRGQYSPTPDVRLVALPAAASPASISRETVRSEVPPAEIDGFQAALETYQRGVEARVSMDTSSAEDDRRAAQRELDLAAKPLRREQARGRAVQEALTNYERVGADYVEAADQRRSVLGLYQDRLDAMDKRISASMNRALKLFGRVFARQSLLRLHASVDELQRRFTDVAAASVADAQALDALAEGEAALQSTFQADTASFSRSEGAEWVSAMHRDLAQLATLRAAGIESGNTLREESARFTAGRDHLLASVPEVVSSSLTVLERAAVAAPAQSVTSLPPAIASPIVDAVTTTTTTTTTVPDRHRRLMVAWITAAVLLVWLTISVWTVRSILVPVGRLIDATRKLARGEDVRASRGGLKELNALSVAFNRMAFQLRAARELNQDYRRTLETQVEQRTRLLQHLAEHDPLTLLANRRQFFVLLNRSLEQARQGGSAGVAVFFIDLDNFKNLNDGMGHAFGDRVLISVAQRLEETAQNLGFAARLGGDEFTIVHEQASSPQSALLAAQRIVSAFERPLNVEGRAITVSVSIGTSFYPDHEQTAEDLLSAADAALFRAKALGRNQAALFTRELHEAATRKFITEQGIRRSLEHEEFELLFQPEVRLDSLRVGLVEALVRWRTPDGRLAAPAEFLAVTEESGLILELGDWVLRRAIETAANWQRSSWPEVKVAINVSPRQLASTSFVDRVQRLLQEFELPARCIELELTESVLQTGAATIESLRLLRSLDIAIALDDFGTGYSSFASFEQLPLSRIKLDRALIAGIDTNPRAAAIAMALMLLCEDLGIEVTAEGVERSTQFSCLAGNPGLYVQGFLISPPVSEHEVPRAIDTMPQAMQDLLLSIPASSWRSDAVRMAGGPRDLTRGVVKR
ncbi:MAG: EAL domain-containing protein [Steroidobacteraceae bacterium]